MILAGLTGGIGAGKSVVGEMFVSAGFYLVDTDVIAREIVAHGQPAWFQVVELFGDEVLAPDGEINRGKLAEKVFGDPNQRKQLEAVLHPLIRKSWQDKIVLESKGLHRGIIVAIPLLYETEAQGLFEKVICVGCSEGKQRQRLETRGWSSAEITQRIAAQWSMAQKVSKADYVVWNDYSLDVCRGQVEKIIDLLEEK